MRLKDVWEKLKEIKPTGFRKPRNRHNQIWKRIEKKQARHYYEKGLYSEEEYKRKVEEINRKYK